ncbi:MAG: hypothetical protein WBE68_15250 [Candidatus Nitrosopolaris sp.]
MVLPKLLVSAMIALLSVIMILPSNAHAVHTPEYLTAFHANDIKVCQMFAPGAFAKVTPKYVDCITGFYDGQHQKALTFGISQYKVGFQLGRNDSVIGIDDPQAACKKYGPKVNYGPEWYCTTGYSDAQTQVQNGKLGASQTNTIKAYHRTLPYRIGFAAGVANKVGVCNQFSGRDATICFNGQTNGFNRNIKVWEQTDIYKLGFKMGFSDAKLGNTPDNVGACDANENFTSTKNLCMSGYDHGYASVRSHHR